MMSKIRNLISKIKNKVKKSEVDDEDEFIEIGSDETEFEDDDVLDETSGKAIDNTEADLDDELDEEELDQEHAQVTAKNELDDDDKTGDVPIIQTTDEDKTADVPLMQTSDDDKTSDVPLMQTGDDDITKDVPAIAKSSNNDSEIDIVEEEDIEFEDDYDRDQYVEEELTNSKIEDAIDLDNSSLRFKDKLSHNFLRFKDKLGRFNRKKFQQLTIDDSKQSDDDNTIVNKRQKKINETLTKAKTSINKIDWRNIHKDFFNENKRNFIHKGFQIAVIFSFVFILGKNMAMLLKGADKNQAIANAQINIDESKLLTSDDVNNIKLSKIFKTDAQKPTDNKKPVVNTIAKCEKATQRSSLPITLIHTIVLQDSVKSIASVQVRSSSKPDSLREGDKIQGIAQLGKIDRMKIIIKNLSSGGCEYVEAKQDESTRRSSPIAVMSPRQSKAFKRKEKVDGIENDGNEFTVEKTFLQDKLKDINSVLTQARGIQLTNPDGSLSFKIVEIQPGSVFSYLGIENNDIITEIGGKKINDLNQVMSLFGKISNLDKLNLKIKRNGEEVPLNYKFR